MNLFSRDVSNKKKMVSPSLVPQDILDAVNVMSNSASGGAPALSPHRSPAAAPQAASPFLEKNISSDVGEKLSFVSEKKAPLLGELPLIISATLSQEQSSQKTFFEKLTYLDRKTSIFITAGFFFLVLVLGLLAWFFVVRNKESVSVQVPNESESVVAPPAEISVVVFPYATDAPNYLSIDIETITAASFSQLVAERGKQMMAAHMKMPVEFLLTDKNNNPIAFSRFAYLMNMEFSEDLLASLGESFSVFLFDDGGVIRLGLSLTLADQVKGAKLITQQEKSLPFLFRSLLFSDGEVARTVVFRSGAYNADVVRFVNVDAIRGISFDFVLRADEWLIGTSKDTLRAILDKKR